MQILLLPIRKLIGILNKVALNISTVMLIMMLAIVTFNVILRYLFSYSIVWSEEASRYLMVWVTFLLLPYAHEKGSLVVVDFLVARFRYTRIGVIHAIIIELCCLLVLCIACYQAVLFVQKSASIVTLALRVPMWWINIIMPYSFALTAVASFLWLCKLVPCLFNPEKLKEEDELRKLDLEPAGH